jgi:hypothetical protein
MNPVRSLNPAGTEALSGRKEPVTSNIYEKSFYFIGELTG